MTRVPAAKIIRSLMTVTGQGNYMFNDRMKNGGRSIKVWGWNSRVYEEAAAILTQHGYKTKMVLTPGSKWRSGSHRLHVFK
jgi:hypothetical protein